MHLHWNWFWVLSNWRDPSKGLKMSENDRSMFQMQQKATLPPNAFLAEFPPSLYSQDNSAQEIRINTDIGWEQRPYDQYHLHVWKEFEGVWQLTWNRGHPLENYLWKEWEIFLLSTLPESSPVFIFAFPVEGCTFDNLRSSYYTII